MKLRYALLALPLLFYGCRDAQKPEVDYVFEEGSFIVTAKDNKGLESITVYDSRSDRGLRSFPISGKDATVTIDDLTNGFELLRCRDRKGNSTYKTGIVFDG